MSTVMTMLLSGARRIEIVQFAAKTKAEGGSGWEVGTRQADKLIADATELIKASASQSRDEEIIEHMGRMDLIFRAAHSEHDYSNAIKAAQDKAKLRGLYPDPRLKVDTWQDELVRLLQSGKVTAEDVFSEFGNTDEARQIIIAAGLRPNEGGQAGGQDEARRLAGPVPQS